MEYGARGSALLVAQTEAGAQRWREAARIAGCRIGAFVGVADAPARIAGQLAADAFIFDVERDEPGLGAALDALERAVAERGCEAVVAAPASLIDLVAGGLGTRRVELLIDAPERERALALALALHTPAPMLNDVAKGQATAKLQQLSEEVGRIASILAALSEDEAAAAAVAGIECGEMGADDKVEAAQFRAIIRARRLRDHFFHGELFADPAWDMLLDLMAARLEKQRVAVSSLCIAAAVPPTTALRWIKSLCDQGIFVRVADPEDGRRVFIELADKSAAAMENYIKAAQRVSALIV
ncbi:MAG TPA: MarR family winged helix-turn-helix transcriptional regulator [Allosphingosinicella sp.]|nr:MarR family winged helix-turn-helix transcriptional regulator [Allosphingosinicella sp.]